MIIMLFRLQFFLIIRRNFNPTLPLKQLCDLGQVISIIIQVVVKIKWVNNVTDLT